MLRRVIAFLALLALAAPALADTQQGGVLYRSATAWKTLAPGANGSSLCSNGPGQDLSWCVPANAETGKLHFATHGALLNGITAAQVALGTTSAEQDGYAAAGDGGGAVYDWSATSTATVDGIFVLNANGQATGSAGRFLLRIPGDGIHPEVAGAVGYRVEQQWDANGQPIPGFTPPDDSGALNALAYYITAVRGAGTILPLGGKFYDHQSTVLFGRHVAVRCEGNPMGQSGAGTGAIALGAVFRTGFTHGPGATTQFGQGSTLEGCVVFRTGLPQRPLTTTVLYNAVSLWQTDGSIGVQPVGDDARFVNDEIIGFDACFSSEGFARTNIESLTVDCANGGYTGGSHDTLKIRGISSNNRWGFNLNGHIMADGAGLAGGGAGLTNGSAKPFQLSSGSCARPPTFAASVAGGAITALTLSDPGDCTAIPANPVTLTPADGVVSALPTINIGVRSVAFRPGIGWNFDGTTGSGEGGDTSDIDMIGYQVGIQVRNWFGLQGVNWSAEGDPWALRDHGSVGIATRDCASLLTLVAPYVQNDSIALDMQHTSAANGGACGAAVNRDASISVVGGNLGFPDGNPIPQDLRNVVVRGIGGANGSIVGSMIAGPIQLTGAGHWLLANLPDVSGYTVAGELQLANPNVTIVGVNGLLQLPNLPTANPGSAAHGQLWNSGGVVNIVP